MLQIFRYRYTEGVRHVAIDGEIEFLERFHGHGRGRFTVEHAHGHFAGLVAKVEIVDAQGRKPAAEHHVRLAADDGYLCLFGDSAEGGDGGGERIIRGDVDGVAFAYEGLRGLLHVVGVGHGLLHHRKTAFFGFRFGDSGLQYGVILARGKHNAYGFRLGHELREKIELLGDGVHVVGAGHVAARSLGARHEARVNGVGHGGEEDGDIVRERGDGLRRRRGDGEHEVHLVVHEAIAHGGKVIAVRLRVLHVEDHVHALGETVVGKGLYKAFAGGIERVVGDVLQNADGDHPLGRVGSRGVGRGRIGRGGGGRVRVGSGGVVRLGSAAKHGKAERECEDQGECVLQVLHVFLLKIWKILSCAFMGGGRHIKSPSYDLSKDGRNAVLPPLFAYASRQRPHRVRKIPYRFNGRPRRRSNQLK